MPASASASRMLAGHAGPMPAAVIARELALPRSTTYHLLAELEAAGFVAHLPAERRYGLGIAVFELGSVYVRHEPLERLAAPLLRKLVDRVGHTAQLGVLHGNELLYLLRERRPGRKRWSPTWGYDYRRSSPRPGGRCSHTCLPRTCGALPERGRVRPPDRPGTARPGRAPPDPDGRATAWLGGGRRPGDARLRVHRTPGVRPWPRPMAAIAVTLRHHCPDERVVCGRTWPELAVSAREATAELTRQIGGTPR